MNQLYRVCSTCNYGAKCQKFSLPIMLNFIRLSLIYSFMVHYYKLLNEMIVLVIL